MSKELFEAWGKVYWDIVSQADAILKEMGYDTYDVRAGKIEVNKDGTFLYRCVETRYDEDYLFDLTWEPVPLLRPRFKPYSEGN